jgi:membrane protein DedA with SNARE-associated domain
MPLDILVARYGLVAVFFGAGIEGETSVIGAGLLAHDGLLDPYAVAVAASAGSLVADQLFFLIGRLFRHHPRVEAVLQRPSVERVMHMLERHPTAFIFGFRFLYGLRTISPIAIGTTAVPGARFLMINLAAAILWGTLFTALGFGFGSGLERLLGKLHWSWKIVAFVALGGMLALLLRWFVRRFDPV